MLTPCGPSAVPTGGAGVAFPAGICNFTCAVIFFAIYYSPERTTRASALNLLDLQEIQFNRRRPSEDSHQNAKCIALRINFVHLAREVIEWPVDNAHVLIL